MSLADWSVCSCFQLQAVRNGVDKLAVFLAMVRSSKAFPSVGALVLLVLGDLHAVGQLRVTCRAVRGLFDWYCIDSKQRFRVSSARQLPPGTWSGAADAFSATAAEPCSVEFHSRASGTVA